MSLICPACVHNNPDSSRFCAQCAAPLSPANAETMTSPVPVGVPSPQPVRHASDDSRFLPGTMLGGRYRMVGLLGRGGMGEVYRADDLKLGQPVALKFLPRGVERDPERLERFLNEVRLSLKVTHPNVCRVFDIGEVGRPAFPLDGVRGRRGPRVAAPAHRPAAGGQGASRSRGSCAPGWPRRTTRACCIAISSRRT